MEGTHRTQLLTSFFGANGGAQDNGGLLFRGSDGPITVGSSTTISVTVTLNPGGLAGNNADWWGAASTPFGWYFYTFAGWTTNQQPVYQGSLFNLPSREVLNMPAPSLPAGAYTLYFGVDTVMDGKLTMVSGYYDSVQINVVK